MIVVDASVAVKLYRDEAGSDAAIELFEANAGDISVPDLFAIEVAGALVRDANIDKHESAAKLEKLDNFSTLLTSPALHRVRTDSHDTIAAAQLAVAIGHPLKDCIYLALAMELGCDLVTCDARFAAKAKGVWAGVRVLGA